MTDENPTSTPAPATPAAAPTPAPPAAAAPAAPATITLTQEQLNQMMEERVARANASNEKTAEERIAALEQQHRDQLAAAEKSAVDAIVLGAVSNTHNPAVAAQIVAAQLGELTSKQPDAIIAKVNEVLAANTWLVKDGAAPAVPPVSGTPGAGGGGSTSAAPVAGAMSDAEFDAITPEKLAADDELMKRYLAEIDRRAA